MENTNTKKKGNKKIIWIISAIVALIICIGTCDGGGSKTGKQTTESTIDYAQVADSVLTYLNSTMTLKEGMALSVPKCDAKSIQVWIKIPEAYAQKVDLSIVGKGVCILTTQWLAEHGYELDYTKNGMIVSCSVLSPYERGVTGREGMSILWGRARYNYNTDSVDWEWEKKK